MSQRLTTSATLDRIRNEVIPLERYLLSTGLEADLLHLIKLRASQINGCAYCMSVHTRDLLAVGERIDRIAVLPAWREAPWFSQRERAALAFTEAVTRLTDQQVPDDVYATGRCEFSEAELADLTLAIATINVWNRLMITWQVDPVEFSLKEPALAR